MNQPDDIWFVYDGECPICTMGASFYTVRQSVGKIHTIDARREPQHPVMKEIRNAALDLDEGMVIKYRNKLYHGKEALHIMAELGSDAGFYNKINRHLFKFRPVAIAAYPFLRLARNIAITLKGAGKIRNLS